MRRRWRGRTIANGGGGGATKLEKDTPPRQTVGVLLAMHSLVSGSFPASIGCNSQVECGAGQASGRILPRMSVYAHLPQTTGKLYQRMKIAPNVGRRWQTRQVNRWSKTSGDTTVSQLFGSLGGFWLTPGSGMNYIQNTLKLTDQSEYI